MTPREILINHYIKRGELKRAMETASKMLKCNEPIVKIVKYTGLSEEEILGFKNN